jgi:histidine triad (HIT) family protein
MDDCIFCKISNGKIPSEKIYENENFFSIYDIHPDTNGHSLVISKRHFNTVLDLPTTIASEFLDAIKETSLKLTKKYKSNGFNVVMNSFEAAGQIVPHFHAHILPRKNGDGFRVFVGNKKK